MPYLQVELSPCVSTCVLAHTYTHRRRHSGDMKHFAPNHVPGVGNIAVKNKVCPHRTTFLAEGVATRKETIWSFTASYLNSAPQAANFLLTLLSAQNHCRPLGALKAVTNSPTLISLLSPHESTLPELLSSLCPTPTLLSAQPPSPLGLSPDLSLPCGGDSPQGTWKAGRIWPLGLTPAQGPQGGTPPAAARLTRWALRAGMGEGWPTCEVSQVDFL